MAANSSKTKSILITTWQKRNSLSDDYKNLSLYLENEILENSATERLLRVLISHNLSWDEHIQYIERTVKKKLALFIGAERTGISDEIIPELNECVHIDMFGKNSSINVINALSIGLYEITKTD